MKKRYYAAAAVLAAIVAVCQIIGSRNEGVVLTDAKAEYALVSEAPPSPTPEPSPIEAYITGEVAFPGVYELPPGARILDLAKAAGGLSAEADSEAVNLSAIVADGWHVHVPKLGETPAPAASGGLINVNSAGAEALTGLPGIGPVIAEGIVRYREENGPFKSVDDLINVPRIGKKTLENLRDLITVG